MEEEIAAKSGSSLPLLAGLGFIVVLIILALNFIKKSDKVTRVTEVNNGKEKKPIDNKVQLNPAEDAKYLVNCLRPSSTPLEILYAIATTPDNVALTSKHLALAEDLREKKRAHLQEKENEDSHKSMDDLFDDDGWAEDDDNDPAAAAAKKAKEEKEKEAKQLAKATGKDKTDFTKVKLEGVDEGVLGQQWVTQNLTKMGVWPPPTIEKTIVKDKKFSDDGKIVSAMDHPAVQRNLVMTMGRLNAKNLNTHPDLVAAGPKGDIDPTYFQATMEYRQRVGQMLEATLRMACTLRSFHLACSILDAIVMFKIGLMDANDDSTLSWFTDLMTKQYGPSGSPKLIIDEKFLGVPTAEPAKPTGDKAKDEAEAEKNKIARQIMQTKQVTTTDEKMALEMQITRQHAESFTKEKIAQCQKQGIPPQIAMQAYREAWFILVRAKKLNDDGSSTDQTWDGALGTVKNAANHLQLLKEKGDQLYAMLEPGTVKAFEKEFASKSTIVDNKMVIGWPFVISNVAQKTGKVKIHLPPPTEPGKYEFTVTIKSQEFLGVGQEFKLQVDVAKGVEKVIEEGDEEEEDNEGKKDK
jgi:hypothetical protein